MIIKIANGEAPENRRILLPYPSLPDALIEVVQRHEDLFVSPYCRVSVAPRRIINSLRALDWVNV